MVHKSFREDCKTGDHGHAMPRRLIVHRGVNFVHGKS